MSLQILIIDDDEIVAVIHKTLIKKSELKAEPTSFLNAKEALKYLESEKTTGNNYLIFLDINMPEMSGWQFLDAVNTKEFAGKIFVVIVTSSINKADKLKATPYKNVITFLEKPMSKEDCDKVRRMPELEQIF